MTDDAGLQPPPTRLLAGDEPIVGTTAAVRDFWSWALSDLRTNTVRPMLAEFLVAQALGAATQPRIEWDAYDVVTPDGIRVEVKSSAYLQAWTQERPSAIRFGGLNGRTWDAVAGYSSAASYNADVYVFAVVTARDHGSYDPLDVAQWSFWVLPKATVEATGLRSLGLSRIEALAGASIPYEELARTVRLASSLEKRTP